VESPTCRIILNSKKVTGNARGVTMSTLLGGLSVICVERIDLNLIKKSLIEVRGRESIAPDVA
jgi:hypothetical protein